MSLPKERQLWGCSGYYVNTTQIGVDRNSIAKDSTVEYSLQSQFRCYGGVDMKRLFFLLAVLAVFVSGCATDSSLQQAWRQGYGFNNPNPERIKQGQPPTSF